MLWHGLGETTQCQPAERSQVSERSRHVVNARAGPSLQPRDTIEHFSSSMKGLHKHVAAASRASTSHQSPQCCLVTPRSSNTRADLAEKCSAARQVPPSAPHSAGWPYQTCTRGIQLPCTLCAHTAPYTGCPSTPGHSFFKV